MCLVWGLPQEGGGGRQNGRGRHGSGGVAGRGRTQIVAGGAARGVGGLLQQGHRVQGLQHSTLNKCL